MSSNVQIERSVAPVTVVVVSYRSEETLERCLQSIYQQTLLPEKVILVENSATNPEVLRIVQLYASTEVIFSGSNLGFSAGNNLAAQQVQSKYIAFLNPDAYADEGWLERLMCAVDRNPSVKAFGSKQIDADDPTRLDGCGDALHFTGLVWRIGHGKTLDYVCGEKGFFSPSGASALYDAEVFNLLGGFDEDFFCYVEDVDLGFRLLNAGYASLFVEDAVVYHHGGVSSQGESDFAIYHGHRNLEWLYIKNMPIMAMVLLLPVHLAMILLVMVYYSMRGRTRVILRAKYDALRGVGKNFKKRTSIFSSGGMSVSSLLRKMVF